MPKTSQRVAPPPDWPTVASYEAARVAGRDCPPHDWKPNPAKGGGHVCGKCEQALPAGQPGFAHLPLPSRFTGTPS